MAKENNTFVLHLSYYELVEDLTDEQAGRLFKAIYRYSQGEEVDIDDDIRSEFKAFRIQLKNSEKKYKQIGERRRKAAESRWHKQKNDAEYLSEGFAHAEMQDDANDANAYFAMQSDAKNANAYFAMHTIDKIRDREKKEKEKKEKTPSLPKDERLENFRAEVDKLPQYDKWTRAAFVNYWTESNDGEDQPMRFEMQKTFSIPNRLKSWVDKPFSTPRASPRVSPSAATGPVSPLDPYGKMETTNREILEAQERMRNPAPMPEEFKSLIRQHKPT